MYKMTNRFYGKEFFFTSRGTSREIKISAGVNEILNFNNSISINGAIQYIYKYTDLPEPVGGVIQLEDGKNYVFLETIDLLGNRLQGAHNSILTGTSSESSNLTSTGLGIGVPLITSIYTLIFQNLTIFDVDTCFNLQSSSSTYPLDWTKFNIENCKNVGLIKDYNNSIISNSAFINCSGFLFDGTINTIGFNECLFTNFQNLPTITIASTATVGRRFKMTESSMVITGTGVGIDFNTSATVNNQGFILTSCNFSGTGNYITGVQPANNKALFFKNLGIQNSRSNGGYYINVSTATPVVLNVWTKLLGSTLASTTNQKFSHTESNRLVYVGALTQIFTFNFHSSLSSGNNNIVEIGVSLNGADPDPDTISRQTADAGGSFSYAGNSFSNQLVQNDYFEIWVRNTSGANAITAASIHMNVAGDF
jgi:hypothetical protein